MTPVIMRCACGAEYTREQWDALPDAKVYRMEFFDGTSEVHEQRMCTSCTSHIILLVVDGEVVPQPPSLRTMPLLLAALALVVGCSSPTTNVTNVYELAPDGGSESGGGSDAAQPPQDAASGMDVMGSVDSGRTFDDAATVPEASTPEASTVETGTTCQADPTGNCTNLPCCAPAVCGLIAHGTPASNMCDTCANLPLACAGCSMNTVNLPVHNGMGGLVTCGQTWWLCPTMLPAAVVGTPQNPGACGGEAFPQGSDYVYCCLNATD